MSKLNGEELNDDARSPESTQFVKFGDAEDWMIMLFPINAFFRNG